MNKFLFLLIAFFIGTVATDAQVATQRIVFTSLNPPTVCTPGKLYTNNVAKKVWLGTSVSGCQEVDAGTLGNAVFTSLTSAAADPADAGAIRLGNNELIEWENNPTGADWTLGLNASNVLITNAPFTSTTINATTGFQLNGNAVSPPIVCSNTAVSTAITTTASKTYFNLNCAIPANVLAAGKTIKLEGRGVFTTAATDTIILTVDVCTVSGCASGTVVNLATTSAVTPGLVTNQGWLLDENTNVFTSSATGTHDTEGYGAFQTAALVITFDPTPNTSTATFDDTVQQFLSVSAKFSTASATDTITLRSLRVTIQ